jgi:4-diphosphocytidyl-2-C-methyl-D-erythritol kinase
MKAEISAFAPAKINLFLEVTGRRENGYHDLATLFAKIAIGDNIKISAQSAAQTEIELKVKGPFAAGLKADKSNLVYKAALAFFEHFNITAQCNIRLEKNIPLASGLGGGSSDAAAVILALCAMFAIEINAKRFKDLIKLTAKLGADVPFFLHEDTFCKAAGIGDELTPVKNHLPKSPYIIVAYPGAPSSTKEAYEELVLNEEKNVLTNISSLNRLIESIEKGLPLNEWGGSLYNKLENGVLTRVKEAAALKAQMLALGATNVMMSGSGSCVFALIEDAAKAQEVVKKLENGERSVFLTHFWRTKL